MRIIDKNTDYYDYLQGIYKDDSLVFDRTNSFVLTKDLMCRYIYNQQPIRGCQERFLMILQVCHSFFLLWIEAKGLTEYGYPGDYTIELLGKWKNYSSERNLIYMGFVSVGYDLLGYIRDRKVRWKFEYDKQKVTDRIEDIIRAIESGDCKIKRCYDKHVVYRGNDYKNPIEKEIPILKESGVAGCIDPMDIYLAIEEYFSLEKQDSERTESVGLTDKEKVENHGLM